MPAISTAALSPAKQAGPRTARVLRVAEHYILAAYGPLAEKAIAGTITRGTAKRVAGRSASAEFHAASVSLRKVYAAAAENITGQEGPLPDAPGQVAAAILTAQRDAGYALAAVMRAAGAADWHSTPLAYRRIVGRAVARNGGPGIKAANAAIASIRDRGLTGYVSPRGRRWSLADYGRRAVRMAAARLARSPVTSQIAARREALLAVHVEAVSAALEPAIARLDARPAVARFRGDSRVTSTASPEVAKRWRREAAQAAAGSWLTGIATSTALVAAVSALATDGMAEGEADAMAVAAQDQGLGSLDIDAAMASALATLRDGYGTSQRARDAAASLAAAVTAAAARALAASGENSTEDEAADGMRSAAAAAVARWTDWALWGALGAGAIALWQRAASALGSVFSQDVMVDWLDSASACPVCQQNAGGSPYAPADVPPYPAHSHCHCELSSEARLPVSWLAAFLS